MAASKPDNGRARGEKSKYPTVEWVNVSLSSEDRTALEDLYANHQAILTWLADVVQMGFKVSVKYDDKNNSFVASIIDASATKNRILTGRGAEAVAALLSALYRFFVILESDLSNASEEGSNDLFD